MKKIIQSLIYLSIAIVFFVSCEKDEAKDTFVSGTTPVFVASVKDSIGLNFNTENDNAVTFSWSNPNYQFASGVSSHNVSYSLEIDTAGANFNGKNKISVSISQDLTLSYTQKAFNILISELKLKTGSVAQLEMRIVANLGSKATITNLASNKLVFKVLPYAPPPKVRLPESNSLFIVGSATPGGWNNPVPVPSQQFTKISNTLYEITIRLTGGEKFIFLVNNGDWGKKYAVVDDSNNGLDVGLDFAYFTSGGKDIPAPVVSGNYKISVDFQTGKYTISKL
jgi:hypothetical protein